MTPDRLRAALRFGVASLLVVTPLPFGSVEAGWVLAIELAAALLGLISIALLARDDEARASLPRAPLGIALGLVALGIFQAIPLPFKVAETFNPTAELVRPLIPYLGGDGPPSVAWSVAAPETVDALLRFIAYVLIGLAAALAFDDTPSRRRLAAVLVGAAVFQAVYGSGEYLSGHQHIFTFAKKHYLDSATGTFINRNHMATLLAIALPFGLVLAIPERERGARPRSWRERLVAAGEGGGLARILAASACAVIWLGLLLSHSRAGLAAAVAGAGVTLYHLRSARAAKWVAAAGAGVLLVLLTMELAQAPGERFFTLKDDLASKGGRVTVWRDSLGLVTARPVIGWGYGTFESAFPTVQSADVELRYDHAHNDWLEWTVEGGVLALAGSLALLALALRPPRRGTAAPGFDAAFSAAARAALAAVALHALWDFSLRIPAVAVACAVGAGVALRAYADASDALAGASAFPPPSTNASNQSSLLSRFQTR